ncbi:concanavalin A-like lectin/glucanase domain-containing protein [Poronia punctata]|nr:concanavalin A-like lectin/glucanase domain-containing protein [Poronia punctata]
MAPVQTFLATALSLAALSSARPYNNNTPRQADCDCYKASSDTSKLYGNRKFFDWRNIENPSTPDPIAGRDADKNAGNTHPYFSTSDWTEWFRIQSWDQEPGQNGADSTVFRVNSANNVFIAPSDDGDDSSASHLTLRAVRQDDYYSTAEAESVIQDFEYLSFRYLARTVGDDGAVTSIFTYISGTQEADSEIRTFTDRHEIAFTNQPGNIDGEPQPEASRTVQLEKPWTEWQEYRYDWTPGSSDWWMDGEKVASIQFQAPTDPLLVIMNVWGDGGSWSDNMPVGGSAEMQVQWLDITYNRAGNQPGEGDCSNVCVVDDLLS